MPQAVQSRHCQQHADPHRLGHPLFQENAENGHQHDVKGGDEARLAGRGGVQTLLLKEGGQSQRQAAPEAAQQQILPGAGDGGSLPLPAAAGSHDGAQHQQKHKGDHRPGGIKGQRRDMFRAYALGYKGGAPDQSRQNRIGGRTQRTLLHILAPPHRMWYDDKNFSRRFWTAGSVDQRIESALCEG